MADSAADEDEDWLYSDGEGGGASSTAAPARGGAYKEGEGDALEGLGLDGAPSHQHPARDDMGMGRRDWIKIDAQFQDSGYREGITAGKQARLQGGFDAGFKDVGAPLGRRVGVMRGETAAMLAWLTQRSQASSGGGLGGGRGLSRPSRTAATNGSGNSEAERQHLEQAVKTTRALISDLARIKLEDVAPIDYEALQHEREHEEEGRGGRVAESSKEVTEEETDRQAEEQQRRESILVQLEERVRDAREALARPAVVV